MTEEAPLSLTEGYPGIEAVLGVYREVVDYYSQIQDKDPEAIRTELLADPSLRRDIGDEVVFRLATGHANRITNPVIREIAKSKYFKVTEPKGTTPAICCSFHGEQISDAKLLKMAREEFPDLDKTKLPNLLKDFYMSEAEEQKPGALNSKDHPNHGLFQFFKAMRKKREDKIAKFSQQVAELSSSVLIEAKQSRLVADPNRSMFLRSIPSPNSFLDSGGQKKLAANIEFPTRARAAFIMITQDVLKGFEKKDVPVLLFSFHGMINRSFTDIIIGGGDRREGKNDILADEVVHNWVCETLAKKIQEKNIQITPDGKSSESRPLLVALQYRGEDHATVFSADDQGQVIKEDTKRDKGKAQLSGALLGWGRFRAGGNRKVPDFGNKTGRRYQVKGVGEVLQFMQTELSSQLCNDEEAMSKLAKAFAEIAIEFPKAFPNLHSLN